MKYKNTKIQVNSIEKLNAQNVTNEYKLILKYCLIIFKLTHCLID
jgi:hypothetical protein